jgi:hypothetical protein
MKNHVSEKIRDEVIDLIAAKIKAGWQEWQHMHLKHAEPEEALKLGIAIKVAPNDGCYEEAAAYDIEVKTRYGLAITSTSEVCVGADQTEIEFAEGGDA